MLPIILLASWEASGVQSSLPKVPEGAEAVSLAGKPLYPPKLSEEALKKLEDNLAKARADYEAAPDSVYAAVWVGRRLAYLGRYRDSIEWYSVAILKHEPDAKLLRHRGHRYITIREFGRAIADLEKGAQLIEGKPDEIEPDGVPNARNTPVSSLQSNVWYHLALARYLQGDFEKALEACEKGMKVSGNPDRLVSQTYWRYLILRRLGRDDEAKKAISPIRADLDVIENHAYLRLLLVYKGELPFGKALATAAGEIETPTTAFGLGAFCLLNGDKAKAAELLERAVSGPNWAAFGFIAAEAELQRIRN